MGKDSLIPLLSFFRRRMESRTKAQAYNPLHHLKIYESPLSPDVEMMQYVGL